MLPAAAFPTFAGHNPAEDMPRTLLMLLCVLGQMVEAPRPLAAKTSAASWPPVAGLAPGRRYGKGRTDGGFVVAFGDLVLRGREDPRRGLETYLIGSERPIAEVTFDMLWNTRIEQMVHEHFASGSVVLMGDGDLVALEPRTLRPRWHRRVVAADVAAKWGGPELIHAYGTANHIVAVLRSSAPKPTEMVVLHAPTGEIAWRRELPRIDPTTDISVAGPRVLWTRDNEVTAVSVADGRSLWTAKLGLVEGTMVATSDAFVVVEVEGHGEIARSELYVLDASTGKQLRRDVLEDERMHQVAIDGDMMVLGRASGGARNKSEDIAYEASDARTGRLLWRTRPLPGSMVNRERILFDVDAVIVNNGLGFLYAFDRGKGALRWFWGLGEFEEAKVLAHPWPNQPGILLQAGTDGVRSFVRSSRTNPPRTATFVGRVLDEGRPVGGAVVVANFARSVSKPDGSYRVSTPARGLVRITAIGPRGSSEKHVDPQAARPFKLDLNVSAGCGDPCETKPSRGEWEF
jgi:hypothetical protein